MNVWTLIVALLCIPISDRGLDLFSRFRVRLWHLVVSSKYKNRTGPVNIFCRQERIKCAAHHANTEHNQLYNIMQLKIL